MTIGGSIALIILGAILAFAVEYEIAGIDITTIGYILMIGGAIGLVFGLIWWQNATTRTRRDGVVEERRVIDERERY